MNQLIVINKNNHFISALASDFDILEFAISATKKDDVTFNIDDVIIGKVTRVIKDQNYAFVEIFPRISAYLALKENMKPIYVNGKQGGMPIQGDLLLVRINKLPEKTKGYSVVCNLPEEADSYDIVDRGMHGISYERVYKGTPDYLLPLTYGNVERIQTDNMDAYNEIEAYLQGRDLSMRPELKFYEDEVMKLDNLYSVSTTLEDALKKKVWIKNGGYLVIERTEALTVIDVNSGNDIKSKDPLRVNIEAAKKAAAEIRLRNISGMILIDFINMKKGLEPELLNIMRAELKNDPLKPIAIDITKLGLMEITRKRTAPPLWEQEHSVSGSRVAGA